MSTSRIFSGLKEEENIYADYVDKQFRFSQTPLICMLNGMGYKGDMEGMCAGLVVKYMEGSLIGESEVTLGRFNFIYDRCLYIFNIIRQEMSIKDAKKSLDELIKNDTFNEKFKAKLKIILGSIEDKVKKGENLSEAERRWQEVNAFLGNIALAHDPSSHRGFFSKSISQDEIKAISALTAPEKLQQQGGIDKLFSESWIFPHDKNAIDKKDQDKELKEYFEKLGKILKKEPDGWYVSLNSDVHRIGLRYVREDDTWELFNPSQMPPKKLKLEEVGSAVYEALQLGIEPPFSGCDTAFQLGIYATGNSIEKMKERLNDDLDAFHNTCQVDVNILKMNREHDNILMKFAVEYGELDRVVDLAKVAGIDEFNKPNKDGWRPAHFAAAYGQEEVIIALADIGKKTKADPLMLFNQLDSNGDTPIHMAAARGGAHVITALANALQNSQIDLNAVNIAGLTPAYSAAQNGHKDVIIALANSGVKNLNQVCSTGFTPVHIAVENGHKDVIIALANSGVNINDKGKHGWTPLHYAVRFERVDMIPVLAKAGADFTLEDENTLTPLQACVIGKKWKVAVNLLLAMDPADIKKQLNELDVMDNVDTRDQLFDEISKQFITYLIDQLDADQKSKIKSDWTATELAAYCGRADVINTLANIGIDMTLDNNGKTMSAHLAARQGHQDALEALANAGVDLSLEDEEGRTPAHLAAMGGHTDALEALANAGVDLSLEDKDGWSPAHFAITSGEVDTIDVLANAKADLTLKNGSDLTPAHLAALQGNTEMINALANVGVDLNLSGKSGWTPAHVAVLGRHADVIKALAAININIDFDKQDENGCTPAHLAAKKGYADVIIALAKAGADLTLQNDDGQTPAHLAAQEGHDEVIEALADHHVDLNTPDDDGWTPAHLAALNGQGGVINALVNHHVDLDTQNNDGKTPADLAKQEGYDEVLAILEKPSVNHSRP